MRQLPPILKRPSLLLMADQNKSHIDDIGTKQMHRQRHNEIEGYSLFDGRQDKSTQRSDSGLSDKFGRVEQAQTSK